MACLVIPFGSWKGIISFDGDFIFFAYILALGKFFSIISAMDTGSSFEGMGASREALYSMLAEPAFFILIGSFALLTGNTSFHNIFSSLHLGSSITYTLGALASFVLIMIAMIENSRMPVDDPKTHLELTMIHEVMILDNSGFDLGLILSTGFLKFAMYGAIIADFFIGGLSLTWALPLFLLIQMLFAVIVGLIESFMARYRMSHNPQFILALSMTNVLLIIFIISLLYVSIANRIITYVRVLALQGFILFGVTFLQLKDIQTWNLVLILLETIVFKTIAVPVFLSYLIKRNKITRETEPYLPHFVSLFIITLIVVITVLLANSIQDTHLDKIFFIVSLSTLFTGLYFIASRKKIITHVMGYLMIENGVFVLSLAVGNEMPNLVNLGIMLDVFASVLILGIFLNKIGDVFKAVDVDQLSNLKDY